MSSIYDWSLLAPENARSDEIINWAEGQPPSTVNNSARAMMQRIREYLSDIGGNVTGEGEVDQDKKTTSYRLSNKSLFSEYTNDITIRFKACKTNVGSTSLRVGSLPYKPVYKVTETGMKPLEGQEIIAGGIYEIIYHCNIAGENVGGWYLTNPTPIPIKPIEAIPTGLISAFGSPSVTAGWLMCDGKAYSRTEYANLFEVIGLKWGPGDGSTTFNVPDLRGMFLRGLDSGKGIDAQRAFASIQNDSFKGHAHAGSSISPSGRHRHTFDFGILESGHAVPSSSAGKGVRVCAKSSVGTYVSIEETHGHQLTIARAGGDETRPVNVAVVYAIKT